MLVCAHTPCWSAPHPAQSSPVQILAYTDMCVCLLAHPYTTLGALAHIYSTVAHLAGTPTPTHHASCTCTHLTAGFPCADPLAQGLGGLIQLTPDEHLARNQPRAHRQESQQRHEVHQLNRCLQALRHLKDRHDRTGLGCGQSIRRCKHTPSSESQGGAGSTHQTSQQNASGLPATKTAGSGRAWTANDCCRRRGRRTAGRCFRMAALAP